LLVRAIDELEPTALGSPGPVRNIFVSADGQSVGFFDGTNALRKVAITGGAAAMVAPPDGFGPRGATWGDDGSIVYATASTATGLLRVSSTGAHQRY
jgi:hypothetical protein